MSRETLLRRARAEALRRYGPLELSLEDFSSEALRRAEVGLCRRGVDPAGRLDGALARAALPDLFLAVACERNVDGAWEALTQRVLPELRAVALRCNASSSEAEEIVASLPGDLVAPVRGDPDVTRLSTYDGSGSLRGWLSAMVARRSADRGRERRPQPIESAPEPRAVSVRTEIAELGERLRAVLCEAWSALTPKESLALLLCYRDGLAQKKVAAVLAVGEPRLSRLLKGATGKLRDRVERAFRAEDSRRWSAEDELWSGTREVLATFLQEQGTRSDRRSEEKVHHE